MTKESRFQQYYKIRLRELESAIFRMLDKHFEGNWEKANLWIITKNPLLGDVSPLEMMTHCRHERLLEFIKGAMKANGKEET